MVNQESEHPEELRSGFKVEDKRKFTSDGEAIVSERKAEERSGSQVQEKLPPRQPSEAEEPEKSVDFAGFLLSLATSAMAYLGEIPDPATGRPEVNLPSAQQMIEILSILQEKTTGNLQRDEDRLLEDLLYELRMKYLKKSKAIRL